MCLELKVQQVKYAWVKGRHQASRKKLKEVKKGTKKVFRGCKTLTKRGKADVFSGKIEKSYISLMSLKIKKQKILVIFEDKLSQVISPRRF